MFPFVMLYLTICIGEHGLIAMNHDAVELSALFMISLSSRLRFEDCTGACAGVVSFPPSAQIPLNHHSCCRSVVFPEDYFRYPSRPRHLGCAFCEFPTILRQPIMSGVCEANNRDHPPPPAFAGDVQGRVPHPELF